MDDQTTQEAPAQSPRPPSGDLLQLLVDALNEVQNASSGLIQALFALNYDEISIYAHDAHSWWQVAKAVIERLDAVEPTPGRFLDHVEHALESFDAAVVGIGHVLAVPARARLEEQSEARLGVRRCHATQDPKVATIHREHVVVGAEIRGLHLRRALRRQVVAALQRVPQGAWIGAFSHVIVVRARGTDADPIFKPARARHVPQDALARGRTADIAGADQKNRDVLPHAESKSIRTALRSKAQQPHPPLLQGMV